MVNGVMKIEVLGNVKFDWIKLIVVMGVDYISLGVLIYLVCMIDLGLDF